MKNGLEVKGILGSCGTIEKALEMVSDIVKSYNTDREVRAPERKEEENKRPAAAAATKKSEKEKAAATAMARQPTVRKY
ncbi:UNVERIFIED_CONTAM: hypothetical protein HDU68_012695 [Siphonaria sp. JEL0065]|nr:hypothetical protein HDU68_012695 [Siphonaria sp. JEL0065]